jgi:hypothetical protein
MTSRAKPGSKAEYHQANQRQEADTQELGERAARGLRSENDHPYGLNVAEHAIGRRTGDDGIDDPSRRRW